MAWDKSKPAGTDLVSDIDTYVIANNTALEALLSDLKGWSNLKVVRDSATQVTVTADHLFLQSTSSLAYRATAVNEAIAITTAGASGLDTPAEAVSTWYYIWIIRKSSDGTTNGLLSTSSTSPTMPADYDQKALVSAVRNDSSGNFVDFVQEGTHYVYKAGVRILDGVTGATWTSVDISSAVPSNISNVAYGVVSGNSSYGQYAYISNVSTDAASATTEKPNAQGCGWQYDASGFAYYQNNQLWRLHVLTANTLYYYGALNFAYVQGFELNKL